MQREEITHEELWEFVQEHKNKTKDQFGSWLIGQSYNSRSKVMKAILEYNEKLVGERT